MTSVGISDRLLLPPVFLLLSIISCAKSVPPPGGPPDESPPQYVFSTPSAGSVRVKPDTDVIIQFTEKLDPQSVARAVYIIPESEPPARVKAKGEGISIDFPGGLKRDRTYLITIGTDLMDAHRINLARSVTIAFATGEKIDTGLISGKVYREGKPFPNTNVVLFEKSPSEQKRPVDSLVPDYLTQSGNDGTFKFEYLPIGVYYLAAFEDKNKNRRINPSKELIGLPFRRLELTNEINEITGIDVRLHEVDTGRVALRTVSVNSNGLIRLRFDKRLTFEDISKLLNNLIIISRSDSSKVVSVTSFTNIHPYPSTDFLLDARPLIQESEYRLTFDLLALHDGLPDSLRFLIADIKIPVFTDRLAPELLDSDPPHNGENISVDHIFQLLLSEPTDTTTFTQAVRLTSCNEDTLPLRVSRIDPFLYELRFEGILAYGCQHLLTIDEKLIRDGAGNVMGDSSTVIAFTTIGRDTLGSLSGKLVFNHPDDSLYPVMIEFKPAPDGVADQAYLSAGEREFRKEFFPGYYTISAYLDKNSDEKYDDGSIIPYRLAEPFTTVTDTFRVRTRFETTGLEIKF